MTDSLVMLRSFRGPRWTPTASLGLLVGLGGSGGGGGTNGREIYKLTFGNINLDYSVNVNDASLLQQYLSGNAEFDSLQMYHADINRDGKINVQDVTALQNALSE